MPNAVGNTNTRARGNQQTFIPSDNQLFSNLQVTASNQRKLVAVIRSETLLMENHFKEIIEGCRKGNRKDQQALYDYFSRKMYRVCLSYTSDSDDAMDILHDSFIKVFGKLASYNSIQQLEAWIRQLTVNTAIDFLRKRKKLIYIGEDEYRLETAPIDTTGQQMENKDLDMLIDLLPSGAKTVFNLYAVEGYNHREIATRLEISEGTSKSQLSRARQLLQGMLKTHYPQTHG